MDIAAADHVQFFTATVLKWKPLLKYDRYKRIVINSLKFLVDEKRILLYAFVIMPNHLHLIWQVLESHKGKDVQRDFLKYTSQQIKADLKRNYPLLFQQFKVNAKDRTYQLWKRGALSVPLWSEWVFLQKLDYIHINPVKAGLCNYPEEYKYSSALFYEQAIDVFDILTHYARD